MHLIGFLIMGAIVGWLAGKLMSGHGYGIIWDIVLGIVGSFLGGVFFLPFFCTPPPRPVISFLLAPVRARVLLGLLHLVERGPMATGFPHSFAHKTSAKRWLA